MDFQEKIEELRKIIGETLLPLINGDYIHLDNPYHGNIGDVLIWEGERTFLSSVKHKCLRSSSNSWWGNFLHPETVILFQGGGNFGDLYRSSQDFRLRIIERFPNNRIIMFPQSVWYEDKSLIEKDAEIMARHSDLTLCARDKWSYDFLKEHFGKNKILLVPDMAFYISDDILDRYRNQEVPNKRLYLRRIDKEFDSSTALNMLGNVDIHDWPTLERIPSCFWLLFKMKSLSYRLSVDSFSCNILNRLMDIYVDKFSFRLYMIDQGCRFMAPYEHVITTRLHALILSVLLHKPIEFVDNTTHKVSAYADTWLRDLESVYAFRSHD